MPNTTTKPVGLPTLFVLGPRGPRKTLESVEVVRFCSVEHRDAYAAQYRETLMWGMRSGISVIGELAKCAHCGRLLNGSMYVEHTKDLYWTPTGYPHSTRTPDEVYAEIARVCHEHGTLLATWAVQRKGNMHVVLVERPTEFITWTFHWWNEQDNGYVGEGHYYGKPSSVAVSDDTVRAEAYADFVKRATDMANAYYNRGA
jgi:hypothetical protein